MPDRVIRDELLQSDRWLDLPTDTDRLAYVGLLLQCDDFGNLEGKLTRIHRDLRFTQIKTVEATAVTISHLSDADLIRGYEVGTRPYFHIPRLRPHRQYYVRKVPASPWDIDRELGKERRVFERGLALNQDVTGNIVTTSLPSSVHMGEGVGVGVGIRSSYKRTSMTETGDNSGDNFQPTKPMTWSQYWTAKGKAFGMEPKQGESSGDYCRRVQRFAKDRT